LISFLTSGYQGTQREVNPSSPMTGLCLRLKRLSAGAALCCLAVACSNQGLSPDASYFRGLPTSTVREALANPTLKRNLEGEDPAAQQSLAQAAVRNMIFCREELHVYQQWLALGKPPPILPGPVPARPLEPGNSAIVQDYARLKAAVASGDPSQLQLGLTANGSCGQWVPATPGQIHGPTIAEVVLGHGP
jgi:hypothetical protein